jgi:hypothetical protein
MVPTPSQPARLRRLAETLADVAQQSGAVSVTFGAGHERHRLDLRPGHTAYVARVYGRYPQQSGTLTARATTPGWHLAKAQPIRVLPYQITSRVSGRRRRFHYLPAQAHPIQLLSSYHGQ